MEDLLYQYNPWWEEEYYLDDVITRPFYMGKMDPSLQSKLIVLITGLRRVGKTTLMKSCIKKLLEVGVDSKHILYISADDYLLNNQNIFQIIQEYFKLFKIKMEDKIYLFLDEITYKADYQQQLKNLYDRFNCKIFASSSSASLLKDRQGMLTGRTQVVPVEPLDYDEYKLFKGIEIKKRDTGLEESYFLDYIKTGGMPENVLSPSREYLMGLVDNIIQKDITAFYGVKNHQIMRDFFTLLMERSGKQVSINKIANILSLSPDTARRYLKYFQEIYLVHLISRYGKTNERILSPRKVYACDLGIKYLFIGERDLGSYFENYIYLKLKDRKKLFYLYQDGIEIDFITNNGELIEAKYYSNLNKKQQELLEHYNAKTKLVIDSVQKLDLLNDL